MKKAVRILIEVGVILVSLWMIIHRRVISAGFTNEPMPEPPDWHKKLPGFLCIKSDGSSTVETE